MRPATAKSSSVKSGGPDFPSSPGGGEGGATPANLATISAAVWLGTKPFAYGFPPRARISAAFFWRSSISSRSSAISLHEMSTTHSRLTRRGCFDLPSYSTEQHVCFNCVSESHLVVIGRRNLGVRRRIACQLQQRGDHELVEVAVQDRVDVADLEARPMVVRLLVGGEYVRPDLAPPLDRLLLGVDVAHFFLLLLLFDLEQLRAQDAHRGRLVLVLGALAVGVHRDPGRDVRDADGGFGLVDVLAAGAARAHDVDAQILVVDLDLDGLVDVRVDEDAGERGVPPRLAIVRRDAHQPVHARFGAQPAVGPFPFDADGGALDPRLVARLPVE